MKQPTGSAWHLKAKRLVHNTYSTVSLIYVLRHSLGVYVCVKAKGELVRKETVNSMSPIMAFSTILACLDSSFLFFLMPWPLLSPFTHLSYCHNGTESSEAILYYRTTTFKYIYIYPFFFSLKSSAFLAPLSFCVFSFRFILPLHRQTLSVYQKFSLPNSTNPFERSEERKYSKDMYCFSYP